MNIDYYKYLSLDNGKGLLISKKDALVLEKKVFDYKKYATIQELIIDIDNYLNTSFGDVELEEVLENLSERYYYNNVNK